MGARGSSQPSSLFQPGHSRVIGVLTEARKAAGLSQQQLADALGRHRSLIWKVEGGQRRVDMTEFVRWLRACDSDPEKGFRAVASAIPLRPVSRPRR